MENSIADFVQFSSTFAKTFFVEEDWQILAYTCTQF